MKVLYLDIETSPNVADVWSLWNNNVSLNQLRQSSFTLCVATMWDHEEKSEFFRHDQNDFFDAVYNRLNEADAVVTYNGDQFDIPTLNKDFWLNDYVPYAPFHSIDLYKAIKKKFKLPSHKLDHIATVMGLGGKEKHSGHELWVRVMAGDPAAWKEMEKYCRKDTELLKPIYHSVQPWMSGHPNVLLFEDMGIACPRCGGNIQWRGYRDTATARHKRYQCQVCGGWSYLVTREEGVKYRNA